MRTTVDPPGDLHELARQIAHDSGRSMSDVFDALREQWWHRFWPDSLPYRRDQLGGVIGHRQVTDAYLVALAADHGEQLVTFNRGLARCTMNGSICSQARFTD